MPAPKEPEKKVVLGVMGGPWTIGTNIVASNLKAHGFEVIDAGSDVTPEIIAQSVKKNNAKILADLKSGLQYVRRDPTILLLLVFTLVVICLSMHYLFLLPIFTDDILKVGASGMGTLMSLSGVGAIVSSMVIASLPNKKRGLMLLYSSILMGLALSGFSFSSSYYLSMGLMFFVGMGQAGRATLAGPVANCLSINVAVQNRYPQNSDKFCQS